LAWGLGSRPLVRWSAAESGSGFAGRRRIDGSPRKPGFRCAPSRLQEPAPGNACPVSPRGSAGPGELTSHGQRGLAPTSRSRGRRTGPEASVGAASAATPWTNPGGLDPGGQHSESLVVRRVGALENAPSRLNPLPSAGAGRPAEGCGLRRRLGRPSGTAMGRSAFRPSLAPAPGQAGSVTGQAVRRSCPKARPLAVSPIERKGTVCTGEILSGEANR